MTRFVQAQVTSDRLRQVSHSVDRPISASGQHSLRGHRLIAPMCDLPGSFKSAAILGSKREGLPICHNGLSNCAQHVKRTSPHPFVPAETVSWWKTGNLLRHGALDGHRGFLYPLRLIVHSAHPKPMQQDRQFAGHRNFRFVKADTFR
jgi:hypothetical protein